MNRFIFLCGCFFPFLLTAQEFFVDWGPDNPRNNQLLNVLPDKGSSFYAFHLSNNQLLQTPKVTRYVNSKAILTKKIDQRIGSNIVLLEELVTFNGTLLGFLSDKKDGVNHLYMVKYDTEIDPYGEPEVITSYPLPKGWNNRGYFNVLTSRNKRFMCVEYVIPGKRESFDRYGYKVLDSTYRVVTEGEYEIPYNSRNASVEVRYVTDSGDYILGVSVYKNNNGTLFKDYTSLEKTIIVHVKGNQFNEYQLEIAGKRVFDIGVTSLDSILIVTGTYGEPYSSGSQGVFMQRINVDENKVISESFDLFPKEFMTQDMSVAQIDRLERRESRGKSGPQLINYAIRGIHPLDDGSTIVVAEQFYIYQQSSTDSRGVSQTIYHYYFNDIVAYKIDNAGHFNWIVRLQKEQHSINDYGYYSSLRSMVSNGKLLCFFNDNIRNYDEAGHFAGFYRSVNFPVRKKSYALALGRIDIQTGEITRDVFCDYTHSNGVVVLKLSQIDFRNREFLLFSQGKRERFGLMNF